MPSGYTSDLYEGRPVTFPEFALHCAHAFGALVAYRESDPRAPLPDVIEPNEYHRTALTEARERLAAAEAMTSEQAQRHADQEYEEQVRARTAIVSRRSELRSRYEAMLDQVRAWKPPTPEHTELKEFMLNQLTESIDHDCSASSWPEPTRRPAAEVQATAIARAREDVAYHERRWDDAVRQAAEATEWLRALRESLPTPAGATA